MSDELQISSKFRTSEVGSYAGGNGKVEEDEKRPFDKMPPLLKMDPEAIVRNVSSGTFNVQI